MILTTLASLFILLAGYFRSRNYLLMAADVLLLGLSVGVVWLVLKTFFRSKPAAKVP
jgi:hypothetical protein